MAFDDLSGRLQCGAISFVFAVIFGYSFGEFFGVVVEGIFEVAEDVFDGFGVGCFGEVVKGVFSVYSVL